jgi:hypothetical protein
VPTHCPRPGAASCTAVPVLRWPGGTGRAYGSDSSRDCGPEGRSSASCLTAWPSGDWRCRRRSVDAALETNFMVSGQAFERHPYRHYRGPTCGGGLYPCGCDCRSGPILPLWDVDAHHQKPQGQRPFPEHARDEIAGGR